MKVRVQLRRKQGRFVPRFGPQMVFIGHLSTTLKTQQDRQVLCLTMILDFHGEKAPPRPPAPELYEARVTDVMHNEIRFMGWESIDHCWYAQEWDCFVLPEIRR